MPEIQLSDLKITKMTSEGWVTVPLSESPYYKCMRVIFEEQDRKKAKNIFLSYIRDVFLYDTRDGKIQEISWNRFLGMYQLIEKYGLKDWEILDQSEEKCNNIRIDSNMQIHDGQHRLAIWYAMGNKSIHVDRFWIKESDKRRIK